MNVLFKCPKCGNMSNPGKFCRYCGAKLNERVLTFENTNTLLRSNVVIKDNIIAHEDDVMDETERNVPLEIHGHLHEESEEILKSGTKVIGAYKVAIIEV